MPNPPPRSAPNARPANRNPALKLAKVATSAKKAADRLSAVSFISDRTVLSELANNGSVPDVAAAARERLIATDPKAIAPNLQEISAQVALLKSYKPGFTTLAEFTKYWTASDALLSKLGIVGCSLG